MVAGKTKKPPQNKKPKTSGTAGRSRRKKNNKNGALKEIKYQQKRTNLLIPHAPFARLVHEIAQRL